MPAILSAFELQQRLSEVLDRVAFQHDQFVIEQDGKALAALVSVNTLERMQRFAREQALATLQSLPRISLDECEAIALVDNAKHTIRWSNTSRATDH